MLRTNTVLCCHRNEIIARLKEDFNIMKRNFRLQALLAAAKHSIDTWTMNNNNNIMLLLAVGGIELSVRLYIEPELGLETCGLWTYTVSEIFF